MSLSTQRLLRAALSLGRSPCGVAALLELGAAQHAAAAATAGALQQAGPQWASRVGAMASLQQLQRAFHTGLPLAAAAEETPAINPLQQAPPPAVARSALAAAASDADAEAPLRARAILRNAAISPRKLNMFAKLVRGLSLADALIQSEISCKKSAGLLRNVMLSAKANAINNHGMDADKLVVEEAFVGSGSHLKRTSIHGRGRSGVRLRYRSHLTVVLAEREGLKMKTQVVPMYPERYHRIQERKRRLGQWQRRQHQ